MKKYYEEKNKRICNDELSEKEFIDFYKLKLELIATRIKNREYIPKFQIKDIASI